MHFILYYKFCFVSGFDDWQHLNPRLPDHEINLLHNQNCIKRKELEKRLLDDKTIDYRQWILMRLKNGLTI